MERIKLGIITKPQALKGAFRVKPSISNFKVFDSLNAVIIDNTMYPIENVVIRDTFVILKLVGIDSCESAEALRNREVIGDVEVDTNNTFSFVDWNASVDGLEGKIVEINNYGSSDIMSIKFDRPCMLPVIEGLITKVDKNTRTIYLNKDIFEQVVVYED